MNTEDLNGHHPAWETCVVCGNYIEPGCGPVRINHRGNTVTLCGPACLETFAEEPDLHLARLAEAMRERALRQEDVLT